VRLGREGKVPLALIHYGEKNYTIKGSTIMTKTSVQAAIRDRVDPVLEVMIKGLVETASRPKTEALTNDAVTQALTEALVVALITPRTARWSKPRAEGTPFETALASALAVALAPALAQSLTPAVVQVLSTMISTEKPGQEKSGQQSAPSEGSKKQETHQ
jgi:hypothetical protein